MTMAPPLSRSIPVVVPGFDAYAVRVGANLLSELGPILSAVDSLAPGASGRRAFLVYDRDLPHEHVAEASRSLAHHGYAVASAFAVASEPAKSLEEAQRVLEELAITKHERRDPVIALGGGIVGDLAGFVASTYRRGVPFVQVPTTLLSMVDASVGGKTGVNLATERGLLKNFVGAFHQPAIVVADVRTLSTLPDRHLRAGLAECIKHGMIGATCGDPDLLEWTIANMTRFLSRESDALVELVARNVALKARVVRDDPREERSESSADGLSRMLLNLGHTFGHVIETLPTVASGTAPHDSPLVHGEAVALGLLAACAAGVHMQMTAPETAKRAREAIEAAGLPTTATGLPDSSEVARRMLDDKKTSRGKLRLVIPTSPGEATIVGDAPHDAAIAGVDAIRG
jgi:3-dehydroquinate synthetase